MDGANCILGLLTDGQVLTALGECHSRYSLTAFDARDESLHALVYEVNDNIMAAGVAQYIVFKIEDAVLDIILQTKEETWLDCHVQRVLGG